MNYGFKNLGTQRYEFSTPREDCRVYFNCKISHKIVFKNAKALRQVYQG